MAAGYSRSVEGASDILFDFPCSSCAKDGHNKEAFHGCVDCAHNFCDQCLVFHNKLGITKGHTIVDKAVMVSSGLQTPTYLPTDVCGTHPGKVMDMYCGTHDVVCCGACIAIKHRPCQGVDYLPNAAKGIITSIEFKDVKDGLNQVQVELSQVMKTREEDLKKIRKDKDKCLTDIDAGREMIVKQLDKMVNKAKEEVDTVLNRLESKLKTDIQTLRETKATLDIRIKHFDNLEGDNELNLFLNVRKGKQNNREGTKLLEQLKETAMNETMIFSFNSNITDYFVQLNNIGEVKLTPLDNVYITPQHYPKTTNIKPIISAALHRDITVSDKICNILGSCLLNDGSLMITDCVSNTLTRLDTSYKVVDKCKVSGQPWGVCRTSPAEVAVALIDNKKIQLVSTSGRLSVLRSFQVKEKPNYLAASNGELFVTGVNPPQVGVYNMTGSHLRTINKDPTGRRIFDNPRGIVLSNDGTKLHVIDEIKGVITMTRQGQVQDTFTDPQLESPFGAFVLENDNLLVCGFSSRNIIQVDNQGRKINVLLTGTDGIRWPQSLTYDAINSRLSVTMYNKKYIKMFNLLR